MEIIEKIENYLQEQSNDKIDKAIKKLASRIGAKYIKTASTYIFQGNLVLSDDGYSLGYVGVDTYIAKDYLKVVKDGRIIRGSAGKYLKDIK
jgi:hypothetical protein